MKVKILVFENINSLVYWFKVVRNYLGIQQFQYFAVKNNNRRITINNQELRFIPIYKLEEELIGLHDAKVYQNMETQLERDYSKTIIELLEE